MIVSTFTEQEILNELVTDFTKSVKPFAKKMARKHFAANAAAFTVGPTLVLDYFYLTTVTTTNGVSSSPTPRTSVHRGLAQHAA